MIGDFCFINIHEQQIPIATTQNQDIPFFFISQRCYEVEGS